MAEKRIEQGGAAGSLNELRGRDLASGRSPSAGHPAVRPGGASASPAGDETSALLSALLDDVGSEAEAERARIEQELRAREEEERRRAAEEEQRRREEIERRLREEEERRARVEAERLERVRRLEEERLARQAAAVSREAVPVEAAQIESEEEDRPATGAETVPVPAQTFPAAGGTPGGGGLSAAPPAVAPAPRILWGVTLVVGLVPLVACVVLGVLLVRAQAAGEQSLERAARAEATVAQLEQHLAAARHRAEEIARQREELERQLKERNEALQRAREEAERGDRERTAEAARPVVHRPAAAPARPGAGGPAAPAAPAAKPRKPAIELGPNPFGSGTNIEY